MCGIILPQNTLPSCLDFGLFRGAIGWAVMLNSPTAL